MFEIIRIEDGFRHTAITYRRADCGNKVFTAYAGEDWWLEQGELADAARKFAGY